MAKPRKYDTVWLPAVFWKESKQAGYYVLVLPQALDYHFPEGSRPMVTIDKRVVKTLDKIQIKPGKGKS